MKTDKFEVGEIVTPQGKLNFGLRFNVLELLEDQDIRIRILDVDEYWLKRGLELNAEYILNHFVIGGISVWLFPDERLGLLSIKINDEGKKAFLLSIKF